MRGGPYVRWSGLTDVCHRARPDRIAMTSIRWPDGITRMTEVRVAPCGVVVEVPWRRSNEGTQNQATKLHLRGCKRPACGLSPPRSPVTDRNGAGGQLRPGGANERM